MRLSTLRQLLLAALLPLACKSGDSTTGSCDASDAQCDTSSTTAASSGTSTGTSPTTTDATATATSGTTTAGSSSTTSTSDSSSTTAGPVACDPDNLPAENSPCATDGEFCSPGCSDPCQFCNVLECTAGTWQPLEVAPAACPPCDEVCPAVLAANCSGGPPDLDGCLLGCGQNEVGDCMVVYHEALACGGPAPMFTCNQDGRPVVPGCEMQWEAAYACFLP